MSLSLSTPSRFRTRFVVLTPSISLSHSPTLVAHRRFSLSYHFNLVSCILLSKHIHLSLCIGVTLVLYFFLFPLTSFFSPAYFPLTHSLSHQNHSFLYGSVTLILICIDISSSSTLPMKTISLIYICLTFQPTPTHHILALVLKFDTFTFESPSRWQLLLGSCELFIVGFAAL